MSNQVLIPKQLQNDQFGFVLLGSWNEFRHKDTKQVTVMIPKDKQDLERLKKDGWVALGKAPFETAWQKNPYKYDSPVLADHIQKDHNFGVIGGFGRLRILDIDDPSLIPHFEAKLGETYQVKTGTGGRHFYLISDYDKNHVLVGERGEFRALNYQVVSAPCLHPLGVKYEPNDKPILEFSKEEVEQLLKPFLREDLSNSPIQYTFEEVGSGRDDSRSGLEFRKVISLLREGKTPEEVYKEMMAYSKWAQSNQQYRDLTFNKARAFVAQNPTLSYAQKKDMAQFQEAEPKLENVELTVYTDADLQNYQPKPQVWLIENEIPEGEIGLIVGKRQDRKTFTALHMTLCLA